MSAADWIEDALTDVPRLATLEETARLLRCSKRTVTRAIAAGRLGAITLGEGGSAGVRVPRAKLREYLESRSA